MSHPDSDTEMLGSLSAWATSSTGATTKKAKSKPKTIEERYQKKTPIEHILHRPESYIGSVQPESQSVWVWNEVLQRMVFKQITFVPGLFKIFDEILVNAADVKARETNERQGNVSQKMTSLKVDIDRENRKISIFNDGDGIPIEIHKEHKVYVPELIFGHLLTSDNYDDSEERVTGGRNGYGAKLTNIFSTSFTVECADSKRKLKFRKTWKNNMSTSDNCKITDYKESKDYVQVTFSPDLSRFQASQFDDDILSLLTKRVYDIAGCCAIKVWLNGRRLGISDFKSYVDLYFPPKDELGSGKPPIKIHEKSGRWETVISMSDGQFQQVSFVNSISTSKGGTHVNYVTDPLIQAILKKVNTKNKGGMELKAHHVKAHLWVFVNSLIVNPTFDSQTKETLTLKVSQFGSKFSLSDKTIGAVIKSEIVESVLMWAKAKQQVELQRKMKGTVGKGGKDHVSGIPKLEDANDAGTKYSEKCTLILTEGESAKTSCVAGFSIVGKDRYGVFPLRGKLLNVREASFKQQVENIEIQAILKIMGLQVGKKIDSPKGLRYGSLMIMTDQDLDGSHIKGLLINMVAHYWPALLQYKGFLKEFVTPIVKVSKSNHELAFFSLYEYEKWKQRNNNGKGWKIRYYKGLGTSTDREFKEYFSQLDEHSLEFSFSGAEDFDAIDMAFNGKRAEDRKQWIQNYRDGDFVDHNQSSISYKDFINKELVVFSRYDTVRSIPNCIDGLKPGQRKVLFAAFKRNLKSELKVAQFIGYISEKTAYHHGEQSLGTTIIGMAQTYVGSNNINLFQPCGQFGSRKEGGKDASAVRYIFTRLSHMARVLFPESDDALLEYQNDDGLMIEPKYYIPIIPLVLVNGSEGIGTGWSSSVPNYNPRDIISNIRRFIKGESMEPMIPWYQKFKGSMERKATGFESVGIIKKLDNETLEVTELPVKVWTQTFKNQLEDLREGATRTTNQTEDGSEGVRGGRSSNSFTIIDYRDNSSHEDIQFTIKLTPTMMAKVEKEGLEKAFKLRKAIGTTNMTLFDHDLKVQRYATELDIIREFGQLRLQFYEVRKEYLVEKLERECRILRNKVKFIQSIIEQRLSINNRKKADIIADLVAQEFSTLTSIHQASKLMWKLEQKRTEIESELNAAEDKVEDVTIKVESTLEKVPASEFEYLLGMSLWALSAEKVEELRQMLKQKTEELDILQRKTPEDLWEADLIELEHALDEQERLNEESRAEDVKYRAKHRVSLKASRAAPSRRGAPKSRAKVTKKVSISDDESSANSSPSDGDVLSSDDGDPFALPLKKTKPRQNAAARKKPSPPTSRASSPQREAVKSEIATKAESSPKPLKGFSLADRIKSRSAALNNAGASTTATKKAAPPTRKQQTLEELLGISSASSSSSLPLTLPSDSSPSTSNSSTLKRTASPPDSPLGPSPAKRQRRLINPGTIAQQIDGSDDSGASDVPQPRGRIIRRKVAASDSSDFTEDE